MKKLITIGIGIIARAAMYATKWLRNVKDEVIPVTLVEPAVSADVAARTKNYCILFLCRYTVT